MHQGTIVLKAKGRDIDPAYLELLFKDHNNVGVATFSIDSEGKNELQQDTTMGSMELKDFQHMQEIFKEHQVLCYFGKHDPLIEGDLQPYGLLYDADSKPIIVAMVTGDYEKPEESTNSGAFHFVHTWLIPQVQKLDRLLKGDVDGIIKELEDPITKRDIEAKSGERGVVALLTNTDTCLLMSKTDQSAEFSWGWVSDHMGFGQEIKQTETPKEEVKAKVGGMLGGKGKQSVPQVASVTPVKQPDKNANSPFAKVDQIANSKTDTAIPTKKELYMAPPNNFRQGKNAARNWYTQYHGAVPQTWRDYPVVKVLDKKIPDLLKMYGADKIKSQDDLIPLRAFLGVDVLPITKATTEKPADQPKKEEAPKPDPKPTEAPAKENKEPAKAPEPKPEVKEGEKTDLDLTDRIIPLHEKMQFRKEVIPRVRAVIQAGKETMDPKAIMALEEPSPKFSQQTGLQIEELMRYPTTEILAICNGLPATACAIILELMHCYASSLKEMDQLTAPMTNKNIEPAHVGKTGMLGKR